jgi:prepilin-type N-terminal cleavage/methylation domain-containing protein
VTTREDGFTVIELLVVLLLIAVLVAISLGFHRQARDRAADAAAQTNLRVATPAFEAWHADHSTYAGMTLAALQATYSPGIQGIEVVSAGPNDYCVRSVAAGAAWYKAGPDAPLTQTACS